MEPITHLMTGACLGRAGFNRKAAYATLAMTIAAEFPDCDVLWSLRGPVAGFAHHRGITHTFVGVPFEAAAIVGLIWRLHRFRRWRAKDPQKQLTEAPVRWGRLWLFSLIALLSHLLLDYTNNYGLRPFFPFNPRWYAGSFVFIFEPVLFVALAAGLLAPALFGLINAEVGAPRQPFRGQGWATAALLVMVTLWTWRAAEHDQAVRLAGAMDLTALSAGQPAGVTAPVIERISASPYPGDPYKWHLIVDTPDFYQIATADTRRGTLSTPEPSDVFYKPPTTIATLIAKRSPLGQAYLDWSSYPLVSETTPASQGYDDPKRYAQVSFRDLRFFYDVPFLHGRDHPALTGTVWIDADRRVVRMAMNGAAEGEDLP